MYRARLDIKDSGLDLAKAVQTSLQMYNDGEDLSSNEESDSGLSGKKKKKKAAKGRGNTSNFSSFRNKTFGFKASAKSTELSRVISEETATNESDGTDGNQ